MNTQELQAALDIFSEKLAPIVETAKEGAILSYDIIYWRVMAESIAYLFFSSFLLFLSILLIKKTIAYCKNNPNAVSDTPLPFMAFSCSFILGVVMLFIIPDHIIDIIAIDYATIERITKLISNLANNG